MGAPAPAPACAWVYTDIKRHTNTNSWSHHTSSFTGFKQTWTLILDKIVHVNLHYTPKLRVLVMSPVVPFEFNVTNDGFWGDTTATLDWCEGNYEVSPRESLSDEWSLLSGELVHCRVLQHSDKPGHDSARMLRHTQSQETQLWNAVNIVFKSRISTHLFLSVNRFLISYVMLLTVGVGSSLFHMTLKYGRIYQFLPKDLFQHNNPWH